MGVGGAAGREDVGVLNNQVIQITIKSPIISIFNSLQNECVVCGWQVCSHHTSFDSMMFNNILCCTLFVYRNAAS